jgi:hypothetical protein
MKRSILTFIITGLFFLSCLGQENKTLKKEGATAIHLVGLSNDHPNKVSMEWFLNNYKEEFIASREVWKTMKNEDLIQKGFEFRTKHSNVKVVLIFCKNQEDAINVGDTNDFFNDSLQKYGVNGAVLFVAIGKDSYEVNDVIQLFAGEE